MLDAIHHGAKKRQLQQEMLGLGEHFLPAPPWRIGEDELRHYCGEELCDLRKNHCLWRKIIRPSFFFVFFFFFFSADRSCSEHVKEGCVLVIMATPSNFYKNSVHAYARELDLSSVLENLHGILLPLEFLLSWDKFCMRNVCQSGQAVGDHSSGFRVLMCCHPFQLPHLWLFLTNTQIGWE